MPHGGIKDVSEECFQQTPLEFEGDDQWVIYRFHKQTLSSPACNSHPVNMNCRVHFFNYLNLRNLKQHQSDFQGWCPLWPSHQGVSKQDDRRDFSTRLNVDHEPTLPIVNIITLRIYQIRIWFVVHWRNSEVVTPSPFSRVETDPADHEHGQGEIIDYVKVPETLEPGWVFDKFE